MLHVLILTCVLDCSTLITAEVNLSPYVTCLNIDCCVLDCSALITAEVNLSPWDRFTSAVISVEQSKTQQSILGHVT
jgi:hypothetical protein